MLEEVLTEPALSLHPELLKHALGGNVVRMVVGEDSVQPKLLEAEAKEQPGSLGCDPFTRSIEADPVSDVTLTVLWRRDPEPRESDQFVRHPPHDAEVILASWTHAGLRLQAAKELFLLGLTVDGLEGQVPKELRVRCPRERNGRILGPNLAEANADAA